VEKKCISPAPQIVRKAPIIERTQRDTAFGASSGEKESVGKGDATAHLYLT